MQGNLNEIDIRSILQLVELGQRTGELFVETYSSGQSAVLGQRTIHQEISDRSAATSSWFVFVSNGQIVYAADPNLKLERLRDYLRRYNLDNTLDNQTQAMSISSTNALEYGYLWALLEERIITPAQGRSIVQGIVRETLFDLLSLHQGSFIFEMGPALAPQLASLEICPLLTKMIKQVQEWNQFYPHMKSPNQCPVISDALQLRQALPENTFKSLSRWADGQTTLRQMSRYLNRDILTVARAIYPFVQLGLVQLFDPEAKSDSRTKEKLSWRSSGSETPRVVCIDDDVAIGKTVEYILQQHGYEVTAIVNPLKALSLVFQLKPDLILCDITMPEIDGYEICAMLRQSTAFRLTPLIMLTGLDGFINRIKARMIGANDYLTKPFGESELLMLIEKYIGSGYPDRPEPELLLADAFDTQIQ